MPELDRRAIVTGLAAVAVAGCVPALPVRAASLPTSALRATPTGILYNGIKDWRLPIYDLAFDAEKEEGDATWHYQAFGDGFSCVVRHLPTGLTFLADREGDGHLSNVELLDLEGIPELASGWPVLTGYSARSIADTARRWAYARSHLPHDERAIYVWSVVDEQKRPPFWTTYCAAPPLLAEGFSREDMRIYAPDVIATPRYFPDRGCYPQDGKRAWSRPRRNNRVSMKSGACGKRCRATGKSG
jgi:hypothetical protein